MDKIKLSALIGDGMVIQQESKFPVWGYSVPKTLTTVVFLNETYTAQTDADGKWRVVLNNAPAGGPYTMDIFSDCGEECKHIIDIYIGDVWLCSGQSNMELPMERLKDDFPEEWKEPINGLIRQFKVPQEWDFAGPREDFHGGLWTPASAETLSGFSGTAWFFAKSLYEKYKTPIGLINASLGGSPVEAWMSESTLASYPQKIALSTPYADAAFMSKKIQENEERQQAWHDAVYTGDAGLSEEWFREHVCDSAWETLELPGPFNTGEVPVSFCGVLWLRREFAAPPECIGKPTKAWLGTITDADTVYVNGVKIGETTYKYPPRKYTIPDGVLRAGKNQITMRVVCNNGQGGVTRGKPFKIFTDDWTVNLQGTWKYKIALTVPPIPPNFFIQWRPMGLYNAMIAPLLAFPVKGVVWYQGESNDGAPDEYARLFTDLIEDWRCKKAQPDMPFLFVQLPLFGTPGENTEESAWAAIRSAQSKALALPKTGMACALDLGEWNDLHPVNKKGVGERLALAASAVGYGEKNSAPGPVAKAAHRRGNRLVITFDDREAGLIAQETPYVSIIADGKVFRLPARIEENRLITEDVPRNAETVLYAWADNPADRQIYNTDGLPALPFRFQMKRPPLSLTKREA
ncbi:MAG: 9-O-acetylesterase [Treponema sp.]|jgi:sialate O-acetylesterase|nr:9-O-acetylesterase [Treponema sp.]